MGSEEKGDDNKEYDFGTLDPKRKAWIAGGGPRDHTKEVKVTMNEDFDLNKTIFKSVNGFLGRSVLTDSYGKKIEWSEDALKRIIESAALIPTAPAHDDALVQFMYSE